LFISIVSNISSTSNYKNGGTRCCYSLWSQIESYYEIANWLCDLEFSLGCIAANFYSIDDLEFCLQCIAANFHSIDYNIHYLVWHLDSLWYKHIICRWKVVHYCLKCNYMYTYEDSYHS
jgi:hypothetical protein